MFPGKTLHTRQNLSPHIDQVRKRAVQKWLCLCPPEWEEWSLCQKRSRSMLSAHAPPEGICLSHMEVRRPQLFAETTCVTINVPLLRYLCPLVSNSRYTRIMVFRYLRLHQSPDWELWLKISWCGEPSSTATRQIVALTNCWHICLITFQGSLGQEAGRGDRSRYTYRLNEPRSVLISRAYFGNSERSVPWFSSVVKQMAGYTIQNRSTARTYLLRCTAASPNLLTKFAYLQYATKSIWAQKLDSQPTKVCPFHF